MKTVKRIKQYIIKEYNKSEQEERSNYKYGIFFSEYPEEAEFEADNIQELIDWVD